MAEQIQDGDQPMMPEPQPVFDVTYQHVYHGQVHKQIYVFLWISLALFVGALLPWNGEFGAEGMTLWQTIMLVASAGCMVNFWHSIKGGRLTLWPIILIEIVGVMFVLLHYRDVESQMQVLEYRNIAAAQAEFNALGPIDGVASEVFEKRLDGIRAAYDTTEGGEGGVGGAFTAPFSGLFVESDPEIRAKAEAHWGMFGMGFHLTWLALVFVAVFVVVSIGIAVATAKPKEDPAEARRKARASTRGKLGGDDEDGDKKDDEGDDTPKFD